MTLSQLMTGRTPSSTYSGWVTGDDMVLAMDCGTVPVTEITSTNVGSFMVAELGVSGLDGSLAPITENKTYIRTGRNTVKTGNQRTFKVTADRYAGDGFQDFCLSHGVKYGTGSAVVRKYVYFNILNGKGEQGDLAIIVESDGSGDAGDCAKVEIQLKSSGSAPQSYTYS